MAFTVREQEDADWPDVWSVLEPVVRGGETYPVPLDASEAFVRSFWQKADGFNAIARDDDNEVVGVYYIKPDQDGPGDHVCNGGYAIALKARGKGLATPLCLHSLEHARAMGFRAMKFNLVVAENTAAIRAWEKAGMKIIGTTPNAFRLPDGRVVDAHIMYKAL